MQLLRWKGGRARVLAGGTDLIPQLCRGDKFADVIIDITGIKELQQIRLQADWIYIGAAVTHAAVANHPLIIAESTALAEGCAQVGSPQIRNMATLMGNVINAQPAADGAIPLAALAAEINIASNSGERWVSMDDAYRGPGLSLVDPSSEIATEIRFKGLGRKAVSGFFRMAKRKALALPIINGAVCLALDDSFSQIREARIALGPVAEKPFRPMQAESFLQNKKATPEVILEASRLAAAEANPRSSFLRGSDKYRREMICLYLKRTLQTLLGL